MKNSYLRLPLPRSRWLALAGLLWVVLSAPLLAQSPRIDPAGIDGTLLLCGRGEVSDAAIERFFELAGGAKAKVVVAFLKNEKAHEKLLERMAEHAKKKEIPPIKSLTLTHKDGESGKAKELLREATGVWLTGEGSVELIIAASSSLDIEWLALLQRGGVIGASGAAADVLDKGRFNFRFGVKIAPGAAMQIKGRTISSVGPESVTIYLNASKKLPARQAVVKGKTVEDLTALRRAARDRAEGFPPAKPKPPVVEKGTLVIVGGGGMPVGLLKKFVEFAGGPGKANIVIFPTAQPDPVPNKDALAASLRKAGANKATVLKGRTRADVESKEYLDTLREATGIWFDGGRQWRFVDCYEGTKAEPLMHDVLARGGVIGGSSAGASIQGDYLCRGGVFDNFAIRYEGYERGLGFLKGVAIDQHFSQRKRQADMTLLMKIYPQYLGIGLDETTAIVVKGSVAEVTGRGKAHFYDARRKVEAGQPDYEALPAGGRYDLKARKVLEK